MNIENFIIERLGHEKFKKTGNTVNLQFHELIGKVYLKFPKLKVVIVAGTNGKGQVTKSLSRSLVSSGFSVLRWTSPHLRSLSERFVYNENEFDLDKLENKLKSEIQNSFYKEDNYSYYEFLFYQFLKISLDLEKLDYLILEVGLGGRLDSVNLLNGDYSVLTSISRDHKEVLGERFDGILYEKLGVTRTGSPHVSGLISDYLLEKEKDYCVKNRITHYQFPELKKMKSYFERNEYLVKKLIDLINEDTANHQKARYDPAGDSPFTEIGGFSFNTAHNLDGYREVMKTVDRFERVYIGFSNRDEKELRSILSLIKSFLKAKVTLVSFEHHRALDEKKCAVLAKDYQFDFVKYSSFSDRIEEIIKTKCLITGSNYFVGKVLQEHTS
ncbi:MAG: hypothetical protein ACPGJV_13840 [Bacteriovoracaceae bacterium]